MFVSPILTHEADTGFQQIKPLLLQANAWPMWLKDNTMWCLGIYPVWVLVQQATQLLCYTRQADLSYKASPVTDSLLDLLKQKIAQSPCPSYPITQGFSGGLMGYLSYPSAAQAHHQHINSTSVLMGFYDSFVKPDSHNTSLLYASNELISDTIKQHLLDYSKLVPFTLSSSFKHLMTHQDYKTAFNKVQAYLHSGDCYQVNLAQAFKASCTGIAVNAFEKLLALSTPPYAAYSHTLYGEILSLSPELFLAFDKDGTVLTRPIKGTRPRKTNPIEDQAQFDELASHPKDRAENLMIVDLLRHDLGKHAQVGSVTVPKLFEVESFAQVHHLISDIKCKLKNSSHPLDLLFDAFPAGSITGAPKKRAMEIIAELENCDRAIYCGSIGYLNKAGDGVWNVAIRTLLHVEDSLYAWAGGGIVADSQCESEYEECFNKIGAMLSLLEEEFLVD